MSQRINSLSSSNYAQQIIDNDTYIQVYILIKSCNTLKHRKNILLHYPCVKEIILYRVIIDGTYFTNGIQISYFINIHCITIPIKMEIEAIQASPVNCIGTNLILTTSEEPRLRFIVQWFATKSCFVMMDNETHTISICIGL